MTDWKLFRWASIVAMAPSVPLDGQLEVSIRSIPIKMKVLLTGLPPLVPMVQISLDKLPAVFGRNPDSDVRLGDRWTSRRHCEISEINGTLVVRDLDSCNGTLVNGQHITEAHLMPGDRLTVGLTSFDVRYKRNPNSH